MFNCHSLNKINVILIVRIHKDEIYFTVNCGMGLHQNNTLRYFCYNNCFSFGLLHIKLSHSIQSRNFWTTNLNHVNSSKPKLLMSYFLAIAEVSILTKLLLTKGTQVPSNC